MKLSCLLPVTLVLALGGILYLHAHFAVSRHSQRVSGRDVLSVAFGDAKTMISRMMVAKADLYFHGGIGHTCEECADAHSGGRLKVEPQLPDPWHWLNERIAAPDVHRHLDGKESVELIPWLWASVKADPHNEEAWDEAWYTAAHMMKNEAVAAEILEEGLKANPNSARLHLTKGQFLYDRGRTKDAAKLDGARACFEKALALAPKDSQIREFAARYLADMDKKKVEVEGGGREK